MRVRYRLMGNTWSFCESLEQAGQTTWVAGAWGLLMDHPNAFSRVACTSSHGTWEAERLPDEPASSSTAHERGTAATARIRNAALADCVTAIEDRLRIGPADGTVDRPVFAVNPVGALMAHHRMTTMRDILSFMASTFATPKPKTPTAAAASDSRPDWMTDEISALPEDAQEGIRIARESAMFSGFHMYVVQWRGEHMRIHTTFSGGDECALIASCYVNGTITLGTAVKKG